MWTPFSSKVKLRKFSGVLEIPNFQQEIQVPMNALLRCEERCLPGRLTYYGKPSLSAYWIFTFYSLYKLLVLGLRLGRRF